MLTNNRIRTLAERALKLANNDVARAIRLLSEMSGLSLDMAFDAVDDVVTQPPIKRKRCAECGVNWADPPSSLCPGCEAYREHQQ